MPCGSAILESESALLDLELDILRICIGWRTRCLEKMIKEDLYAQRAEMIQVWKLEWDVRVNKKTEEIEALMDEHDDDPSSITAEDWDNMARGSERMIAFILSKDFPKETWAEGIPYLNMIARQKFIIEKEDEELLAVRAAIAKAQIEAYDPVGEMLMKVQVERQRDSKWQRLKELYAKARSDEMSVSLKDWEDASEGSLEVLERHPVLGAYIKRAREQETGKRNDSTASHEEGETDVSGKAPEA